jgi:hypothetical protein
MIRNFYAWMMIVALFFNLNALPFGMIVPWDQSSANLSAQDGTIQMMFAPHDSSLCRATSVTISFRSILLFHIGGSAQCNFEISDPVTNHFVSNFLLSFIQISDRESTFQNGKEVTKRPGRAQAQHVCVFAVPECHA